MAQTQPGISPTAGTELKLERNAGLIMGTNNSSIVSKRSVEKLYLPQPHFYRYFVRKPQRRSPTINRGYWLRMQAVDHTIRQFLEKPSKQRKVIINLGAGYDPLPFQWLASERGLCDFVKFIDVDYEELMISKREIIKATPKMRDLLDLDTPLAGDKSIVMDSVEYTLVGCDMRNLTRLEQLVRSVTSLQDCLVLCIAEVSITYMPTNAADALLAWSATLSEGEYEKHTQYQDVTFCLIEQRSPDREDHPFTTTMLGHFAKLGTPLRSVSKYPTNHTQTSRFFAAGFQHVEAQTLWQFWANPQYFSPSQRMALDAVESFDEWEEFALFASHYCLIVANNRSATEFKPEKRRRDSCASISSDLSTRTASPSRSGSQWFAYRYCKNPDGDGRTHHATAYPPCDTDALALHGGIGSHGRLSSTFVYVPDHTRAAPLLLPPESIGARCCHTTVTLGDGNNMLIGGRASPTQPMKDCYIQAGNGWVRIHDLPKPRYRHKACPVTLPNNVFGAIVFGGKNGPSVVDSAILLWVPDTGWQSLRVRSSPQEHVPRFSASFINLGSNHGFMFGGMRQDGVICQGFWRWRLVIRDSVVAYISFKESTALDISAGILPWFARMGASHSIIRNEVLVIGGVAKEGCIPKVYEILSISGSLAAVGEYEQKEMDLRVACVEPKTESNQPRPLLVGHSSYRTRTDQTLIMGGGATCFSFGAYWNAGVWLLHDREAGLATGWRLIEQPKAIEGGARSDSFGVTTGQLMPPPEPTAVQETTRLPPSILHHLILASAPRVLRSLHLGPCLDLWQSTFYLKSRIPQNRKVVVHRSPSSTMNFQTKNFAYDPLPFHDFLDQCSQPDTHLYLRSLSNTSPSTSPTQFSDDFPEMAEDFELPLPLKPILRSPVCHSSPLRISSNLNMWLHYDVMSNILFQIRGSKKLILFPPEDIKHLGFPAGATTSKLDITPDMDHKKLPGGTHPVIALLNPGDALYIPPLWCHAGVPVPETRVAPHSKPDRQKSPAPSQESSEWLTSDFPMLGKSISQTTTLDHRRTSPNGITTNGNHQPSSQTPAPDSDPINISLNIFFHSLSPQHYAAGRDVYGNRDLAAYEEGRRDLDKIVQRFQRTRPSSRQTVEDHHHLEPKLNGTEDDDDGEPAPENSEIPFEVSEMIPKEMTRAYLERLANELLSKARAL